MWTWPTPEGWDTVHATYMAWSYEGEVTLGSEHTAFRWTGADDYVAEWCHERLEAAVPAYAVWIRQVRLNVGLAREVVDPQRG